MKFMHTYLALGCSHTQNFHYFPLGSERNLRSQTNFHTWAIFNFRETNLFVVTLEIFTQFYFTLPSPFPPWPPLSSGITIGNHTIMSPSFPRPAIASEKLFGTGLMPQLGSNTSQTAQSIRSPQCCRRLILCKCSAHGLQGLKWLSIDPEPSGESARTGCWKVCSGSCDWRSLLNFFSLCMWPWLHQSLPLCEICLQACKESLFFTQVLLKWQSKA